MSRVRHATVEYSCKVEGTIRLVEHGRPAIQRSRCLPEHFHPKACSMKFYDKACQFFYASADAEAEDLDLWELRDNVIRRRSPEVDASLKFQQTGDARKWFNAMRRYAKGKKADAPDLPVTWLLSRNDAGQSRNENDDERVKPGKYATAHHIPNDDFSVGQFPRAGSSIEVMLMCRLDITE